MKTTTQTTGNIFTMHHEPRGFLVQSQGNGKYMILRSVEGCWTRVAENFDNYVEACNCADRML